MSNFDLNGNEIVTKSAALCYKVGDGFGMKVVVSCYEVSDDFAMRVAVNSYLSSTVLTLKVSSKL